MSEAREVAVLELRLVVIACCFSHFKSRRARSVEADDIKKYATCCRPNSDTAVDWAESIEGGLF